MKQFLTVMLGGVLMATSAFSASPPCLDSDGNSMEIDNASVIQYKYTTRNGYLARAYVQGEVTRVYPDRNGHDHFSILFSSENSSKGETLEVVYNKEFGRLPRIQVGMRVEACGDYITSFARNRGYPPSPDGAIIHWVHWNPSGRGHKSGFLVVDGVVYGQEGG